MHQRRSMPIQAAPSSPASLHNGHAPRRKQLVLPLPQWDADRRELSVDGIVVKQFRRPAPLQEAILAAFEELGWPARIDDPLPPRAGRDQKQRLRETIANLNENHRGQLLRFTSDGRGEGICHEIIGRA